MSGWFKEAFGFAEGSYEKTAARFRLEHEDDDVALVSDANGARYLVGPFETPSLHELRARAEEEAPRAPDAAELGGLAFEHVVGDVKALHRARENAGAVFQAASQFNCLEMVAPGVRPEDGITGYWADRTQGPACALACPGALAYRQFFAPAAAAAGAGAGAARVVARAGGVAQLDLLADVGAVVGNDDGARYWRMSNGYCLPLHAKAMAQLGARLEADAALRDAAAGALRVGVHASTAVGAVARVTVFLTALGGGAFGNRPEWIVDAIACALAAHRAAPLDVRLVHYGAMPRDYAALRALPPPPPS